MFHEEYTALCNAGVAKNNLLKKNPLGYFISSMVAGMFISFGSMVAFVLGQSMDGNGAAAAVATQSKEAIRLPIQQTHHSFTVSAQDTFFLRDAAAITRLLPVNNSAPAITTRLRADAKAIL